MSNIPFLYARDLVKSYADRRVLDGVSLSASPGQRIGLVGENGVGKSTLLRLLAGVEEPDSGMLNRPGDCGFLWQELPFEPDATVQDVIDDALAEIRRAKARLDELTEQLANCPEDQDVLAAYGDVLEWAQDHDLWDADWRAELVLAGLGLTTVDSGRRLDTVSGVLPPRDLDRPVGQLSIGQRRRVALALLIAKPPEVLLLDEPTNHLSLSLAEELEDALKAAPGAVVIASHDRWLRRTWEGPELSLVDGMVA